MFKKSIFIISILLSTFVNASEFQFSPSSSIPAKELPLQIEMPISSRNQNTLIRVKVFPHTLKNDWRHGVPDNKKELNLVAEKEFTFKTKKDHYKTKNLKIKLTSNKLKLSFNKMSINTSSFELTSTDENPITFKRVKNPKKLHFYSNKLEISISNNAITVINELPMEEYLRGVVPSESPSYWPIESLKAQAVAARTYSYYHFLTKSAKRNYHVDDTARYQVFTGLSHVTKESDRSVKETEGEILKYNDKVIVAFFHSYSGGTTDSAKNIFKSNKAPYCAGDKELFSREDLLKEMAPNIQWIVNWTKGDLTSRAILAKLKNHKKTNSQFKSFKSNEDIEILENSMNQRSGTVQSLLIKQGSLSKKIDFTILRTVIGWSKFPSYHFRVHRSENSRYSFKGHGWGHHVGMSQWGAFMMAKHFEANYKEILNHYYLDVSISKI